MLACTRATSCLIHMKTFNFYQVKLKIIYYDKKNELYNLMIILWLFIITFLINFHYFYEM